MERIVFADDCLVTEEAMAILRSIGVITKCETLDELRKACLDATIILSEYTPITAETINSARNLKGIIAVGAGYNHIDIEAANNRKVLVTNARGANAESVAELTIGLMLSLARKICLAENWTRAKNWETISGAKLPGWFWGKELHGKTVGIIGLGEIGRRIARICVHGFQMNAITARSDKKQLGQAVPGVVETDLDTLFSTSDFVTIHVPLSKETRGLVNRSRLGMMKRDAFLINTSRGAVVDEAALIEALKAGIIAGAALDVFSSEPLNPVSELFTLENVVITPHIGGYTEEATVRISMTVAEEAVRISRREKPRNAVNAVSS